MGAWFGWRFVSQVSRALDGVATWLEQRANGAPPELAGAWRERAQLYRASIGLTYQQRQYAFRMNATDPSFDISKLQVRLLDNACVAPTAVTGPLPDTLVIDLHGELGVADLADLERQLAVAKNVLLEIDSTGGCILSSFKLFELLADKNTTATVVHKCFSAAVFILQAAKKRRAKKCAQFMIHSGAVFIAGNAAQLRAAADLDDQITKVLHNVLARRTALPSAVISEWLTGGDKYFSAAEALSLHLIDEIIA
jgi:ATP-dependent protease ClpP protease subunit